MPQPLELRRDAAIAAPQPHRTHPGLAGDSGPGAQGSVCKLFFKALVRRPMISQACLDRAQASFILSRKFLL